MAARFEIYRTQDGGVEQLRLRPGENRVRVLPGRQFRLQDSNLDAEQLRVLQVDSDLVIENVPLDGDAGTASVILEGYYRICSASDQCAVTAGGDETVSIPDSVDGAGGCRCCWRLRFLCKCLMRPYSISHCRTLLRIWTNRRWICTLRWWFIR